MAYNRNFHQTKLPGYAATQARSQPQNSQGAPVTSKGAHIEIHPHKSCYQISIPAFNREGVWGSAVSSPSGVLGRSPSRQRFWCILDINGSIWCNDSEKLVMDFINEIQGGQLVVWLRFRPVDRVSPVRYPTPPTFCLITSGQATNALGAYLQRIAKSKTYDALTCA